MNKLFIISDCEECDEIKDLIQDNNEIEVIELIKKNKDGVWLYDENPFPHTGGFPVLYIEPKLPETRTQAIIGKEGILSWIKFGYLWTPKFCPYIKKECIGSECAKFAVLKSNVLPEGNCVDQWQLLLMIEQNKKLYEKKELVNE